MTDSEETSRDDPDAGLRFERGDRSLVAFVLATAALAVGLNAAWARLSGPDTPPTVAVAGTVAATLSLGVVAAAALRHEGVHPSSVGLAPGHVVPGVVAVGGLWAGLNATAVGVAALAGVQPPVGYVYEGPLVLLVAGVVGQYLVVGPVEELVYRGYLQNKLVDRLGGHDEESARVLGIEGTALVFAAMHVPNRLLVHGDSPPRLVAAFWYLVLIGVLFGVVYEATGNLVLVGLLHGTSNRWLLLVDPRQLPTGPFVAWAVVGVVLLGVTVGGYRRWAAGTDGPRRVDVGYRSH